jgi:hypothetical protein
VHTKVKVSRWIDTPDIRRNREFVTAWHYLLNRMEEQLRSSEDEIFHRQLNMMLLQTFYMTPYVEDRDFYEQFAQRKEDFYALTR